jgi:hypothetical protein
MFDPTLYYPSLNSPYKSWTDKELVTGSQYIFTCLDGNEHFLTIAAEVTSYGGNSEQFATLVARAGNRDKNAVAAKDMGRLSLIEASYNLTNSVTKVAGGDFQALRSTGMEMRKRPQPVVLGTPSNLVITANGTVGQLKTKVNAVNGVKGYIIKYTIDPMTPGSQWENIFCSTSQCVINGLQSGAKYWIVVGAMGSKEQTTWGVAQLSPFVP